jgi:hypothetical protein
MRPPLAADMRENVITRMRWKLLHWSLRNGQLDNNRSLTFIDLWATPFHCWWTIPACLKWLWLQLQLAKVDSIIALLNLHNIETASIHRYAFLPQLGGLDCTFFWSLADRLRPVDPAGKHWHMNMHRFIYPARSSRLHLVAVLHMAKKLTKSCKNIYHANHVSSRQTNHWEKDPGTAQI